ncbi:MAG TPA: hypothetical protein VHA37_05855, partial [Candidatus Saccharimonadales bacterium]|nr:hypothetical protein [Candidatus Saccharimonadales bacterium]
MTQRGPETLSRFYGFGSAQELADSLPPEAQVVDAGAGASTFGHTIAGLRPDISWTNLDTAYKEGEALDSLKETAPPNLHFVRGSILEAAQHLEPESFDRTYSH